MRQMLNFLLIGLTLVGALVGCSSTEYQQQELQGGSEAGNSPYSFRRLVGNLPSIETSRALGFAVDNQKCGALSVRAISNDGALIKAPARSDCSFSLVIASQTTYSVYLQVSEQELIPLRFQNHVSTGLSSVVNVSPSYFLINLGQLMLMEVEEGIVALPENEPAAESDHDGDGIPDFTDTDTDTYYDTDEDPIPDTQNQELEPEADTVEEEENGLSGMVAIPHTAMPPSGVDVGALPNLPQDDDENNGNTVGTPHSDDARGMQEPDFTQ